MGKIFKNNKYRLIGIVIIIITILLYKATDLIIFARKSTSQKYNVYIREVASIPVLRDRVKEIANKEGQVVFDTKKLTAKAVYIEDVGSGTQLFEKNKERLLLPASTTKIMTALVARDEFELEEVVVIPEIPQVDGSNVGLFVGEEIIVKELLKAALIQSSNDSAYALALNYSGGLDKFVDLMNKKADSFGLKSTYFENPAGFDSEDQRSSAHDLAILSKELMKDDFLREVVGIKEEVVADITGTYDHYLYNTHQLLGEDGSVIGIKTGTTDGAQEVLITQFNRENRNILIVLMGSDDRYQETSQLIDWVFDEFIWLTPEQIIEKS